MFLETFLASKTYEISYLVTKVCLQHLELIELSSINKVSLVYVSSCSNTGSIRDDPN